MKTAELLAAARPHLPMGALGVRAALEARRA